MSGYPEIQDIPIFELSRKSGYPESGDIPNIGRPQNKHLSRSFAAPGSIQGTPHAVSGQLYVHLTVNCMGKSLVQSLAFQLACFTDLLAASRAVLALWWTADAVGCILPQPPALDLAWTVHAQLSDGCLGLKNKEGRNEV